MRWNSAANNAPSWPEARSRSWAASDSVGDLATAGQSGCRSASSVFAPSALPPKSRVQGPAPAGGARGARSLYGWQVVGRGSSSSLIGRQRLHRAVRHPGEGRDPSHRAARDYLRLSHQDRRGVRRGIHSRAGALASTGSGPRPSAGRRCEDGAGVRDSHRMLKKKAARGADPGAASIFVQSVASSQRRLPQKRWMRRQHSSSW